MATDDDARQEKSAKESSLGTKVRPRASLFFHAVSYVAQIPWIASSMSPPKPTVFGPGRPRQALRSSGRKVTGPAGGQAVRRLDRAETDAI